MSVQDDLRQLADFIDNHPTTETAIHRNFSGGHFVYGATDKFGVLCNELRAFGPYKVDVRADASHMHVRAKVGALRLSAIHHRPVPR